MLDGTYNPGQLIAVREITVRQPVFDTAVSPAISANYHPFDNADDVVTVIDIIADRDGTDTLSNIERLQFRT